MSHPGSRRTVVVTALFGAVAFLAPACQQTADREWKTYTPALLAPGDSHFSFEYPGTWDIKKAPGSSSIQFSSPDESEALFLAVFAKSDGALEPFASGRFSTQSESFKSLGAARTFNGPGWTGLMQEADGKDGRRVILCVNAGNVYASLSLYLDSKVFESKRAYYERIFKSLRFHK